MFQLNSKEHLDIFIKFIEERRAFCLIRPSDGEYSVLIGNKFNNIDDWHFNGTGSLKDDLSNQLHIASKNTNTYIGIPCQGCSREIMDYYMRTYNMNKLTTTFANIFCNSNWLKFTNTLKDNNTPIYYIGPKITSTGHRFNIVEQFEVDPFLVNKWDIEKDTITSNLLSWISSRWNIYVLPLAPYQKYGQVKHLNFIVLIYI